MNYFVMFLRFTKSRFGFQKSLQTQTLLERTCKHVWNAMQHKSARTGVGPKEPARGKGDRKGEGRMETDITCGL